MAKKKAKKAAPKKKAAKKVAKKKAAKKVATKKPAKKVAKKKVKRKPNPAFMAPKQPDDALAAIVGSKPLPRTEITKKIWVYIKKNKLQDDKDKRAINCDAQLAAVCGKKKKVDMFQLTKYISQHIS